MKIRVINGVASIRDNPVFIGTTGEGEFPEPGEPMSGFVFRPKEGVGGTLVFDYADPNERSGTSKVLLPYRWENGKLDVCTHLDSAYYERRFSFGGMGALMWDPDKSRSNKSIAYTTETKSGHKEPTDKTVPLLDLLRFLEGKISLEELDKKVISN